MHFGLGQDHAGTDSRPPWLSFPARERSPVRAPFFGPGTHNTRIGFCLISLQSGADVFHRRRCPRYRSTRSRTPCGASSPRSSTALGDHDSGFSITSKWLIEESRRRDDTFADAGDDRFFHSPISSGQIGSHGHAGTDSQLNAILGHCTKCDFFDFVGSGQSITLGYTLVRTASSTSRERRGRLPQHGRNPDRYRPGAAGDDRCDYAGHVAASQVMRLEAAHRDAGRRIVAHAGLAAP